MRKIVSLFIFSLFNLFNSQITELKYSDEVILNQKYHNFIKFRKIKDYTPFNNSYNDDYWSQNLKDIPEELKSYSYTFNYLKIEKVQNKIYALGINSLGFWLIINENKKTTPYFIGIAQDKFLHIKTSPIYRLIKNNKLQLECSIIKQTRSGSHPMITDEDLPKYKVLKDNLLISINLEIIKKDSDRDGYNDIFENYIGLNPKSKDSDNDGIDDNEDFNPLYKSIDNDYTSAFNKYINGGYIHRFDNLAKIIEPIFVKEHQVESDSNPFKFDIYMIGNSVLRNIDPNTKRILILDADNYNNNLVLEADYKDIEKIADNEFKIISAFENGSSVYKFIKEGNDWILYLMSGTVY